jgi:lysozyme family protein
MADFHRAIPAILEHEGGYVNDLTDPGGATNYGISLRFLRKLNLLDYDVDKDGDIDAEDIRKLPKEDAIQIYKTHFWDKYHYGDIHSLSVATKIFDMAVHMGPLQAHKLAQKAANLARWQKYVEVDGILGKQTLNAINHCKPHVLIQKLREQCAIFYIGLVKRNPQFKKYWEDEAGTPKGWQKRAYF